MPDGVRNSFRPILCPLPKLDIILRILLAVANFPNISVLIPRLEAFCNYLIINAHIPEDVQ